MTSDELNWRFLYTPRFFLYLSLGLHLTLPFFFWTMKTLDRLGWSLLGPRVSRKEIYQEFIQVDVVGLPDQLISQQNDIDTSLPDSAKPTQVAPPLETTKADTEDPDVMADLEAKAKAEKERLAKEEKEKARKERERALKELEAEAKRQAALKALAEGATRGRLKGNILSKGTSTKGAIGTAKDRYISLIAQKVKQNFNVYSWQKQRGLVSVVYVKVGSNGRLLEKRVVRSSKDPLFDSAVLQAVVDAQPLPVPDDASVLKEGITIEFRPDE